MAVVKANSWIWSKRNGEVSIRAWVKSFVACLDEGLELREAGIKVKY